MRLWILSDLHRDIGLPWEPADVPDADVAVVAGDAGGRLTEALGWLGRVLRPRMRVVFVAGNHEYYRTCMPDELARGRAEAVRLGVDFLEDEAVWIGDVAVAGSTLWTDYALDGEDRVGASMRDARHFMNDHRLIDRARHPRREAFLPEDAAAVHRASRLWLDALFASPAWTGARARVVVTHHAPVAASLDPAYAGRPLNPAFGSRLDALVRRSAAALWVHGHVHAGRDHRVGGTRVLCNPKGYPGENPRFDPGLVVDLAA